MAKKTKTISGAMESIPNISHNRREHIPPNSDTSRLGRNYVLRFGNFSLEQVYDKLFQKAYADWREIQIKKSRGERAPETYYEKILQDKKKKPLYEIIWQIGDMMDTGFATNPEDARKAEKLLNDFMLYIFAQPNVYMMTPEDMENPDFEPPFEVGLILYEIAFHGDENSPHMHMTYIPYVRNMKRGSAVQNSFTKAFEGMGYFTKEAQAKDKAGNLVWQTDENGTKVAQKKRTSFGGVDWVEEQKAVLQAMMEEKYGWEREYKGSNPRGNLLLADYRREMAAKRAKTAELERMLEESKLAEVSKETAKAEDTLKSVREATVVARDNLELLNAEATSVGNRLSEYKTKLMEEKTAYEQLTADIADGAAKKEVLDEEIMELRKQAGSKMVDVRELQKLITEYTQSANQWDERIKEAEARMKSLNDSIARMDKEFASLMEEVCALRDKKDAAVNEEQAVRSDLENEIKKRDELKSEVAVLEKKAEESKRIAIMFASKPEDAYFEMREKYLDLMADNERLKEENRGLKHKLEQAYEFMKQFVINGKNMLEAFLEKTGQVIERVLGR